MTLASVLLPVLFAKIRCVEILTTPAFTCNQGLRTYYIHTISYGSLPIWLVVAIRLSLLVFVSQEAVVISQKRSVFLEVGPGACRLSSVGYRPLFFTIHNLSG